MSLTVFGLVMLAALLHAAWNAMVKGAADKLSTTILVAVGAGVIAAAALPFLPQPAVASWPFLAASVIVQVGYYFLLARAYHVADMSQVYPLMRGTAPLIVALVGRLWLGESLHPAAWAGIALICGGVLALAGVGRGPGRPAGLGVALLTATCIAGYTLIDGVGVRRSGAPAAYTLWLFLLTALPLLAWVLASRGRAFVAYARSHLHLAALGGLANIGSYGVVLWAMTHAPVAVVAALRETSILFATVIAALFLRERMGPGRVAAACVIAVGAVVMRLA